MKNDHNNYNSLLDEIGKTPLIKLDIHTGINFLAKLEYLNPGGSIKDRAALSMVEAAEARGDLKKGGTIVEASSGNQGIALAMIGAIKGYRVIVTVKKKVSQEKQQTLRAYGAEVVVCSASDDMDDPENYHNKAVRIKNSIAGAYMPNQHFNIDNADAYYKTLGPEIWQQTNGQVTHFIAPAGTGGTINGTSRYLKEQNPDIKVIAIDAANSWRATNGNAKPVAIEGMGVDYDNKWLYEPIVNEFITVTDDQAIGQTRLLAKKHGILVGGSSGAIVHGAIQLASKLNKDDIVVMVFPDSGRAYLSKNYF